MRRTPCFLMLAVALAASCLGVSGCSAAGPRSARIPAERYEAAFDASRETLRDAGFALARVDAAHGIISTRPKDTAGLFTPDDREQRTLGQAWQDALSEQSRVVHITFTPAAVVESVAADRVPPEMPTDLREVAGVLVMHTQTTLLRARRPGQRPETEAFGLGTVYVDPIASMRGRGPTDAPLKRDEAASAWLMGRILRRLEAADAR